MEDRELIELIAADPDQGIRQAFAQYGQAANTICKSILKNALDGSVDEAVSDTFFKLWKKCESFHPGENTSLKSYIYTIARNTSIDLLRREKNSTVSIDEEEWFDLEAATDIEGEVQEKLMQQALHQTIAELGEPDHTIFLYKYFLGMRNKEIARQLKIADKKVENVLFRGKSKLKKMLSERGIRSYEER